MSSVVSFKFHVSITIYGVTTDNRFHFQRVSVDKLDTQVLFHFSQVVFL